MNLGKIEKLGFWFFGGRPWGAAGLTGQPPSGSEGQNHNFSGLKNTFLEKKICPENFWKPRHFLGVPPQSMRGHLNQYT